MRLPDCPFFLFGAGDRRKLLYRRGELLDARTGDVIYGWKVAVEHILPEDYTVRLETAGGKLVAIREDERGLWLEEEAGLACLSERAVRLPRFDGHPHAKLLRVLHHELLVNVVDGGPVPNLLVYGKPWYRDAALVCMCLKKTGNLHLVEPWIRGLREPFDRNNAGHREPDNLGEALYLIWLVSDASHPLVATILDVLPQFRRGNYIAGLTDGGEHPVYQTKWLKFGLRALGLDDPYGIPMVFDSYSSLFWMGYRDAHVDGPRFDAREKELYPYLGWAEAHFHQGPPPLDLLGAGYPLTWESHASEAHYPGMAPVCQEYVDQRTCAPHSWHAAEAFLYLLGS